MGRNWTPVPYGDIGVRVGATEKGEALYHRIYKFNRGQFLDAESLAAELEGRRHC